MWSAGSASIRVFGCITLWLEVFLLYWVLSKNCYFDTRKKMMFSEYFLQCLWAVTSLSSAISPDKRILGVVDLYIHTVLGNRESLCGLWSLSDLPGKSMKKRTHSLAIAPCYHCNTDHFDWLERDDLAHSLPPAYRWMQVENRSTDKRCTDCCGGVCGGRLDDRQFPAPHLRWGHCALHTQ